MTEPHVDGLISRRFRGTISLREFFGLATIAALAVGLFFASRRLAVAERELQQLRREVGHLEPTATSQIAAVRIASDEPLTYRFRVRVPEKAAYRLAYSTLLPRQQRSPRWYSAVPVPAGESLVTVRIARDPRDEIWKITTLVRSQQATGRSHGTTRRSQQGTRRMATRLPEDQVAVFRGSHDVVSTGIGRATQAAKVGEAIRVLDERWLVGEGALLLYGDRPPDRDQLGVYAELQPDAGTL